MHGTVLESSGLCWCRLSGPRLTLRATNKNIQKTIKTEDRKLQLPSLPTNLDTSNSSKWNLQAKETWDQSETQALLHTASSTATLLQGVLEKLLLSVKFNGTCIDSFSWKLQMANTNFYLAFSKISKIPALAQNCSKSAGAKEECPCSLVRRRSRQLSMTSNSATWITVWRCLES